MARINISIILDKKTKLDTNYLLDKRWNLSSKLEKKIYDAGIVASREKVLVIVLYKKRAQASLGLEKSTR